MTANPCPSCGSTRNLSGETVCASCNGPLLASSSAPLVSAALTDVNGRKYPLSPTVASMIGSRGCAILLSGTGIETQHAKLIPSSGGYAIEPMMGTVSVNGFTISNVTPLIPGMNISIGSVTLTYFGPSAPAVVSVFPPPAISALPLASASSFSSPPSLPPVVSLRGGSPAPRWLTKTPPALRGIVREVDYKTSTHSNAESGTTTDHSYWIRIEESSGGVAQVFMNSLPEATVSIGDSVSFWGQWRNGILYVQYGGHGFNHSTSAIIFGSFSIDWWEDLKDGIKNWIKKIFP